VSASAEATESVASGLKERICASSISADADRVTPISFKLSASAVLDAVRSDAVSSTGCCRIGGVLVVGDSHRLVHTSGGAMRGSNQRSGELSPYVILELVRYGAPLRAIRC